MQYMLYNIRRYNRYKQTYKQAVTYATYAHIVSEHQANKTHAYKQVTGARAQKQTNKTNKQTNKQTNVQLFFFFKFSLCCLFVYIACWFCLFVYITV